MAENTNAQDWQDDLETYHDSYANVIVYDEDQVTHLTDFGLQPAELRVVFAALRDAAQSECGHNDQGLNEDRLVVCYECGYVFPPAPETAELRPKVTPELMLLSKQVLIEHGHADAMPGDPGSIAQLTVALRSLIKAVEN